MLIGVLIIILSHFCLKLYTYNDITHEYTFYYTAFTKTYLILSLSVFPEPIVFSIDMQCTIHLIKVVFIALMLA